MAAVQETLQQLVQRRQRELGGGGGALSTRQVWLRGGGEDEWSYETVRRIVEVGHRKIGDKIADRLAVALDLPVSKIIAAAGQRPRMGRFEMPRRADRLSELERRTVLSVVDAILDASQIERVEGPRKLRAVAHGASTPGGSDEAAEQAEEIGRRVRSGDEPQQ